MTTTTNVEQVKLNIMTSSQYSSATKNANELYMVTDAIMNYNDLSNKPDLSVYALDNAVVHLADAETITGEKTFSATTYGTASDVNGSIVTTANKSKAANGYFKLGNGLIIQWFSFQLQSSNSTIQVTFPTAFASTNYKVVSNKIGGTTNGVTSCNTKTTTSCEMSLTNASGWCEAIAIGY